MPTDNFLSNLQELSFRGIKVPCVSADSQFTQQHEEHRVLYQNSSYIESLGKNNTTFSYSIPFRNGITVKYRNIATVTFSAFLKACQDSTAGTLTDPVYGSIKAKVKSLSVTVDPNKRDGFDAKVEFVQVSENEYAQFLTPVLSGDMQYHGSRLDTAVVNLPPDKKSKIGLDILNILDTPLDIINKASGLVFKGVFALQRVQANVDKLKFAAYKAKTALSEAGKTAARAKAIAESAIYAYDEFTSKSTIKSYYVTQRTDVMYLAQTILKVKYSDFRKLNPNINTPFVEANTTVFYVKK